VVSQTVEQRSCEPFGTEDYEFIDDVWREMDRRAALTGLAAKLPKMATVQPRSAKAAA
jgi:hypothetical protein